MMKATTMKTRRSVCAALSVCALAGVLAGCGALSPSAVPRSAFYLLDPPQAASVQTAAPVTSAWTLLVNPPHAAAGFDSHRIIYVRHAHQLEYFSQGEWADPPARMLGTLLVSALAQAGAFRAVVLAPGSAAGDWRLDTEIIRLQHDFRTQPSHVLLSLRASLVDDRTRKVIASRDFDATVPSASEDAPGGVAAASQAARAVLDALALFCAEAVRAQLASNATASATATAPRRAPSTP